MTDCCEFTTIVDLEEFTTFACRPPVAIAEQLAVDSDDVQVDDTDVEVD